MESDSITRVAGNIIIRDKVRAPGGFVSLSEKQISLTKAGARFVPVAGITPVPSVRRAVIHNTLVTSAVDGLPKGRGHGKEGTECDS